MSGCGGFWWHTLPSDTLDSVTHHAVVYALVVGAEVVFINGAHHTELIIYVLECRDAVSHVNTSFEFLVNDFVTLDPSVALLVVDVVLAVFL